MKTQAIKLDGKTMTKLKDVKIEIGGVQLKTYEDKINHLIWFYSSNKNNNGKS